jgi:hypothetical protein
VLLCWVPFLIYLGLAYICLRVFALLIALIGWLMEKIKKTRDRKGKNQRSRQKEIEDTKKEE